MINFIKELQPREIKLIIIAVASAALLLILFAINNIYSRYDSSLKNLNKAKSDYEYVFKKGKALSSSISVNTVIDKSIIDEIVISKSLTNIISNIEISANKEITEISFNSSDLQSSLALIEAVSNRTVLNLSNINYINSKNDISVSFILN
tara:strand:- start:790 stop:1239 length:450 start_codon:yes stop_codon:yes gene_type:complete